ncbi:MAG TPA: methylmalonyl Co-A mutase-associated GTPase MeaB, partial [Candidatus Sulfopaludibacter sp.]|nr:methylmalonyl Co-A mutase-associated GTPase MeaB [Candidatus Sulfopaludibacter sp.]
RDPAPGDRAPTSEKLMNELAAKIRHGDARALARAASAIENRDPQAHEILHDLDGHSGHALIIGITGPPGAGKSTLVDAMALELRRQGKTVAIIAVDPSSRITGGAILGDRIRMQQHHADPGIFIRSMATRGSAGGIARTTAEMARLMDAAGRDFVLIETVGVGQDEIEIARLAQVTVVVLVPGMGDDVQAIKAGIMEIAGVFAINKSDQPGADRVEQELRAMLSLTEGRQPSIVRTVATEGAGIRELLEALQSPAPRSAPPDPVTRVAIDHLGIAVNGIEQVLAFYQSIGLAVEHRETVDTERVHVAMLPAGDSRIELLEPASPDSPISKFLDKRGPGLHHVALRVPDLGTAVERLRASGARLLNEPRAGAGGHLYVFVHPASTGGVLLELIQENDS